MVMQPYAAKSKTKTRKAAKLAYILTLILGHFQCIKGLKGKHTLLNIIIVQQLTVVVSRIVTTFGKSALTPGSKRAKNSRVL